MEHSVEVANDDDDDTRCQLHTPVNRIYIKAVMVACCCCCSWWWWQGDGPHARNRVRLASMGAWEVACKVAETYLISPEMIR